MKRSRRWLRFFGAVLIVASVVALVHALSPHAPGAARRAYDSNARLDIDARALFYSEVGPVSEFLDPQGER